MGIFDAFKAKKKQEAPTKMVAVDNIYLIDVPEPWNQFPSDRFRMASPDQAINFSITNYSKEVASDHVFRIEDLKNQTLPMFERFVKEAAYEKLGEAEIGNNYIYQAFKTGPETQYYYYTHRLIKANLFVIIAFILKETGTYKAETKEALKRIADSIKHKVA